MIRSISEAKAKLSELIELANQGEDVLITVNGKIKARLNGIAPKGKLDLKGWLKDLKSLDVYTVENTMSSETIIEKQRKDR